MIEIRKSEVRPDSDIVPVIANKTAEQIILKPEVRKEENPVQV